MTVITSVQHATILNLVTLATAQLPNVLVIDGPYQDNVGDQNTAYQRLFIGADTADPTQAAVSVDGDQVFQNTGTRNRTERFTVLCVADAWDPNDSIASARSTASAIYAGVETFLRGTNTAPNAANINGAVQYAEIGTNQIIQSHVNSGAYVEWRFAIRCTAYLQQI